jgi:hypothetical protein
MFLAWLAIDFSTVVLKKIVEVRDLATNADPRSKNRGFAPMGGLELQPRSGRLDRPRKHTHQTYHRHPDLIVIFKFPLCWISAA